MNVELPQAVQSILLQFQLAAAGVYVAKLYMHKHEAAIEKLVSTFENEVKTCEERFSMVFTELMKIKEQMK